MQGQQMVENSVGGRRRANAKCYSLESEWEKKAMAATRGMVTTAKPNIHEKKCRLCIRYMDIRSYRSYKLSHLLLLLLSVLVKFAPNSVPSAACSGKFSDSYSVLRWKTGECLCEYVKIVYGYVQSRMYEQLEWMVWWIKGKISFRMCRRSAGWWTNREAAWCGVRDEISFYKLTESASISRHSIRGFTAIHIECFK